MEISYFEMNEGDIPGAVELERENFSQPWSEAGMAHYMESGSTIFVCAKHEDKLVGYGAVLRVLDEADLVSLVVDEPYRNMGIAAEILDILYDLARKKGVSKLHLEVRKSNESAIWLYEKEGFRKVGERRGFYERPKEDALLYTKEL